MACAPERALQRRPRSAGRQLQEAFDAGSQCWQHGLQVDASARGRLRCTRCTTRAALRHLSLALGKFPRLDVIDVLVHPVRQQHDLAQGLAEFAGLVAARPCRRTRPQAPPPDAAPSPCSVAAKRPSNRLLNETRRAAGDVDVLAHQVAVDAGHKVFGVELDVLNLRVQLGARCSSAALRRSDPSSRYFSGDDARCPGSCSSCRRPA